MDADDQTPISVLEKARTVYHVLTLTSKDNAIRRTGFNISTFSSNVNYFYVKVLEGRLCTLIQARVNK